jgi:hypothetical protein
VATNLLASLLTSGRETPLLRAKERLVKARQVLQSVSEALCVQGPAGGQDSEGSALARLLFASSLQERVVLPPAALFSGRAHR